jgi:Flp pilus assembly protein TadG
VRVALHRLLAEMRLLRFAEAGTAAVEFALVLPIMLMLYIGFVEVSALITADRKLQSASGALGDLVARSDKTVPAATLEDYFKAAAGIMTPHPIDELEQIVTQVFVDEDGEATVVWSREYRDGTMSVGSKYQQGDDFALPDAMAAIATDANVIVAEGSYAYPPLYGFAFDQTINLYRENFFMPRFGGSITIN